MGLDFVRMKGLEPPCLAALDPKSSASTSFATSANGPQKYAKENRIQTFAAIYSEIKPLLVLT